MNAYKFVFLQNMSQTVVVHMRLNTEYEKTVKLSEK